MPELEINRGTHGAKRASFQKTSYRDIALKLLLANPDEEVEDIAEEFVVALLADRDALTSLAIYGLANVKASIVRPVAPVTRRSVAPTRERVIEREATKITKRIVENLLDFPMPGGKTLAQSTGAECTKAGGWLVKVGKRVGPRGIVGDMLSNAELKKLLKS